MKIFDRGRRKGDLSMSLFIKIIAVFASFIIILTVMYKFYSSLQEESVEQACRASVVTRSNLKVKTGVWTFENLYPIQCKTKELNIPEKLPSSRQKEEVTRNQVKEEIAEAMAKCWWMMGNGAYHNLLDDSGKNDDLCHVCYSFTISPSLEFLKKNQDPITMQELIAYLNTHQYHQGLLQGGGAETGEIGSYDFTPQSGKALDRNLRSMTAGRLLAGKSRYERGIADFSGLFSDDAVTLNTLRQDLAGVSQNQALEPAIIIIPAMSEREVEDNPDLAMQIIEKWDIGNPETNNALAFIFILDQGKVIYATQRGADAVLPMKALEADMDITLAALMANNQPKQAIMDFTRQLRDRVTNLGDPETINQMVAYQRTYSAYIGGGLLGAKISSKVNDDAIAQGGITYPEEFTTQPLIPGTQYAITYISTLWNGCTFIWSWCGDDETPNRIGISTYDDLFKEGKLCNVYKEDG